MYRERCQIDRETVFPKMASDPTNLCSLSFTTESDVEQKLIITLLTSDEWLGIPLDTIHSKQYLPPVTIDKGAGRRIGYYPDEAHPAVPG
jgi:hypothetical protein